ncbi:MAG TPA: sigma-70 family RNA polymerase sigma factor [Lacunisphaera sp.]|nr:sigma-70 family RNA polymerase sigma factor [Lacunisphaera sp.]
MRSESEAHTLFDAHVRIAERAANWYRARLGNKVELNELRAFAFIGLFDAARKFVSATRSNSFEKYARARIGGAIKDGLRSLEWRQRRLARGRPELENVRPVSDIDVERFADLAPVPEELLEEAQGRHATASAVARALAGLLPREREIIRRHYFDGVSFEVIAREQAVSQPRISQLKRRALQKLRELLDGEQDLLGSG